MKSAPNSAKPFRAARPANPAFRAGCAPTGHWQFDLPAYVAKRGLKRRPWEVSQHADLHLCRGRKHFFSFRRTTHRGETDYGRQISAITLL